MGRNRTINPELFVHEDLFDRETKMIDDLMLSIGPETPAGTGLRYTGLLRLAWAGLLTQADREGRFKWKPRRLKLAILPYDDVDFATIMAYLEAPGYIVRYEVDGETYGWIPSFLTHQSPNGREAASELPNPESALPSLFKDQEGIPVAPNDWTKPPPRAKSTWTSGSGQNYDVANPNDGPYSNHGFPLNKKGTVWLLPVETHATFVAAYPAVVIEEELAKAVAWLVSNPAQRKTARGMAAFLNRWMSKQQNKGGSPATAGKGVVEL